VAKIMVVDDDPHIRELIRVYLSGEGLDVIEAGNGQEALSILESMQADLVVLDIMMPLMNGWDLCRELRANYDMPLLMVTAQGESGQKVKGFQLGTFRASNACQSASEAIPDCFFPDFANRGYGY
jgi:DNA-binding response OmpR family regulator